MSILLLLPVAGSRVQFVLSCPRVDEQWLYLARWLTLKSIAFCSSEEYKNPDNLKAQQLYCVIKSETVMDSYLVFQVLKTPDWEQETPAPQFTADVGSLAYVLVEEQKDKDKDPKLSDRDIEEILRFTDETKDVPLL
jgi:hypothetical protein